MPARINAHRVRTEKARDARRLRAINAAVHILAGYILPDWTLAEDHSTITLHLTAGDRVYSLVKHMDKINQLLPAVQLVHDTYLAHCQALVVPGDVTSLGEPNLENTNT